jgi:AraC-like DNA-binding protein
MNLTEYLPTTPLKPFIKSYRVIESTDGQVNRVLPNTSFTLAFQTRGQVSYVNDGSKTILPTITLSGLRKSVRLINYSPQTTTIIVLFKESCTSAFFGRGIHELYEQSVSLDNFFSQSEISMIEDRLQLNPGTKKRIQIIEAFLQSKLTRFSTDKLVSDVTAKINSVNGNVRIKEIAREFYISQDALEKRFRRITGATPKQFSNIVKMNFAIRQYNTVPSFLNMAFENGYYDQPHFNKDFKIFTGQTPTDFFQSTSYW